MCDFCPLHCFSIDLPFVISSLPLQVSTSKTSTNLLDTPLPSQERVKEAQQKITKELFLELHPGSKIGLSGHSINAAGMENSELDAGRIQRK